MLASLWGDLRPVLAPALADLLGVILLGLIGFLAVLARRALKRFEAWSGVQIEEAYLSIDARQREAFQTAARRAAGLLVAGRPPAEALAYVRERAADAIAHFPKLQDPDEIMKTVTAHAREIGPVFVNGPEINVRPAPPADQLEIMGEVRGRRP